MPFVAKETVERRREVDELRQKFARLGLTDEIDGVRRFFDLAEAFVEEGVGASGKIKLAGMKRVIEYVLSVRSGRESTAKLTYVEHV